MKFLKNVKKTAVKIGADAEDSAVSYLENAGLKLITRNYRLPFGEIDIIMKEEDVIVFVEVRYRKSPSHGEGVETVTYMKQQKIIRAAEYFLQQKKWREVYPCRFDVVTIEPSQDMTPRINWLKNAFQLD